MLSAEGVGGEQAVPTPTVSAHLAAVGLLLGTAGFALGLLRRRGNALSRHELQGNSPHPRPFPASWHPPGGGAPRAVTSPADGRGSLDGPEMREQ